MKRVIGLLLIVIALIVMQPYPVGAQSQNFNQVQKTAGATAAMFGAGAAICTALTAGGCGVPMVIGGVVMGTIAATAGYPPTPQEPWSLGPPPDVSEMPDYCDLDCGGSGGPGDVAQYGWMPW